MAKQKDKDMKKEKTSMEYAFEKSGINLNHLIYTLRKKERRIEPVNAA